VPTIALFSGRDDIKLGLRFELCSRRAPTGRGLSKSAMRSASMLDPPALMRRNSIESASRPRIAFTWLMARKNHEFTSNRISVLSPGSSRGTASMHSMQHPSRPKSRTLPLSRDPFKGRHVIWARPLQEYRGIRRRSPAAPNHSRAVIAWGIDAYDGMWLGTLHQWLESTANFETEVTDFFELQRRPVG